MIKAIIFDFSRVVLHPKDKSYKNGLNELHSKLKVNPDYSLSNHFELNKELLDYLSKLKNHYPLYIFTKDYIQEEPELKPHLDKIFIQVFSAHKLGLSKEDTNTFKKLANEIKTKPEEILFIDDLAKNVKAAKKAGLKGIQFLSSEQLFKELAKIKH